MAPRPKAAVSSSPSDAVSSTPTEKKRTTHQGLLQHSVNQSQKENHFRISEQSNFHRPAGYRSFHRTPPSQSYSASSTSSASISISAMSRPTNASKGADDSVMTNGTFMVMTRPDGTRGCVKHPQLTLEGWTCPECEKEFNEGHNALQQRKANLDNRLQELGQQQQQQQQQQATGPQQQQQSQLPPGAHSPMVAPMQVTQPSTLYGAPALPPSGGPATMAMGPYGTPGLAAGPYGVMSLQGLNLNGPGSTSSSNSNASLETLALQINRMQQMQDWMLLQKEREVQMLRQELAEANQKLHTTQLEHALLQEKMAQQKIQHEQELKYLQLSAAAAASNNFSVGNSVSVSDSSKQDLPPTLKDIKVAVAANNSAMSNKDAASKATASATGASNSTTQAGVLKQAPIAVVKPNNTIPPAKAINNDMSKANGVVDAAANINSQESAPIKTSPPKKTAPKKNPPPPEAAKKTAPTMKQPPPTAAGTPPNNGNVNNATTSNSNNNTNANNNTSNKERAPINHIAAKHTPPPRKNDFGIPTDINVDDDAPPTVPLQEDITLGTLGKTQSWRTSVLERTTRNISSDRFEPRYIGSPNDADNNNNGGGGEGMEAGANFPPPLPNDQQSLTVASSTYGEDRQKVVNQSLLDPYGDKGIYTGLILKSTGMPHGRGRMIYEEDQRIYEGEWRHGRWHGFGRAKFANGDSYEGEYRFDQRHGHGKYSWADGRSYDGQFSEDRRHGKGLFVWPDGAIYEGQFANGQREGHGKYKFSDGGQYTGDWKDGRYNGFGTCSWEDGRCYRGEWRNGMAHGKGIETYADSTVRHDGQWEDDEPVR